MCDNNKSNNDSQGQSSGYGIEGGRDIDTSDRTQRTSDGGHIPGRYQFEETIDVSKEYDSDDSNSQDDILDSGDGN